MRQDCADEGRGPTKAGIDSRVKLVRDLSGAMREMTQALKKGGADMLSALQTIATAEALQERKRKTENYRAVQQQQGVPLGRTYEELPDDPKANAAGLPFIIRRGRSIMKSVFKEESVRMAVNNVSESFREKPGCQH